jgi:hypothetical protein
MKRKLGKRTLTIDNVNNDSHFRVITDLSRKSMRQSIYLNAAMMLEAPKPSVRYSYPLFVAELRRNIRRGIFGEMSEHEWEEALARQEVIISPSGDFVTINALLRTAGFAGTIFRLAADR